MSETEKKYFHQKWQAQLFFAVSIIGCLCATVSAIVWNASHINIKNLCGNQFTYPTNIASCNSWSHTDNLFGVATACYGIPCFLGFLILGMIMLFSYMDKKM